MASKIPWDPGKMLDVDPEFGFFVVESGTEGHEDV